MNYADWINDLAGWLPENVANTNTDAPFITGSRYNAVIDRCIEYAELRIYRDPELDLLAAHGYTNATCNPATHQIALPSGVVVVEEMNIILPSTDFPDVGGTTRSPIEFVSSQFLHRVYPSASLRGVPTKAARVTYNGGFDSFLLGPAPDQAYVVEFYGTVRPTPLSYANTTTPLTLYFPDIFIAASMIFMAGYQKTFGAISGDPQQGMTWEQYYGTLKHGAAAEEARKKYRSAPLAAPPAPPGQPGG